MNSNAQNPEGDVAKIQNDQFDPLNLSPEILEKIEEEKKKNPGMFISAWQEDDVDIEKDDNDSYEIFLTAAEEGNLQFLKELLEKDPRLLNAQDKDGYTALHRAAYMNHYEVVSFLLESGADAEIKTHEGWTPLFSAANWGNYQIVGRLLSHGVDANIKSNGNNTALHIAINSSSENPDDIFHTVRYLLQAPGIDASISNGAGDTPIILARRSNKQIYQLMQDFFAR